jgi:Na+-translocating ferredoxin:NAD+ oxidoreductase subunit A
MEYFAIVIGAIFVNNIVLAQFWESAPIWEFRKSIHLGGNVGSGIVCNDPGNHCYVFIYHYMLEPFNITYLQTISYILVISSLVQMVEIILKKVSPELYQALGIFLPLITTNCAIMGVALLTVRTIYPYAGRGICHFTCSRFCTCHHLFAGIREHMELMDLPKAMRGAPAAL